MNPTGNYNPGISCNLSRLWRIAHLYVKYQTQKHKAKRWMLKADSSKLIAEHKVQVSDTTKAHSS